ncbi:hypothetical protein A3H10_03855 [Candidatus Uhrbacteria bacterium RIFCSPLOWO2_12_FULL_46_10]|uniref:PDZ domain-containing protein n=1 Tax=Candidatus Uhrbacteria bacterium RIFCSPLOWO2_01_FULL_47_25 TaxID=1802402 RepID=A0A1F7URS4_9BACT|nr:MAG: 2-alkenal reductase [Parcubacteria group bacterium GW2011_GWA2_46_9]OGL60622.1 MAG: hypothetical protein A2752_02230 [Candidatus Uhrbacteria bacterium RIFCSPHIGHO2_01_FULL_46_23]OGL68139.1 MAG: hypothetical protein A3D60_04005 [Candidatus Uhrbacteria bacterium RIFCSPHIGHO2_02_FULL_47_29]OGL74816.1 MAG: hypothetical protein A3E96_04680 [Candidatus Uhrbacteria bacterium RIFCSPHIGHO2_12_FULL_46_13]OGL80990.1 MAG: hypothetical protein A2936_03340 [Candidatus Uhrbacteria bacterium RIFCSPLOWO
MVPEIPTFPSTPRRSAPLLIVMAMSLVAGSAGAFLLFWLFPEFRQANIPPGTQSVIIERPGRVVIEESTRLRELGGQNKRLVAGLYRPDAGLKIGATTIFPNKNLIGVAVLLTADGWFATVSSADVRLGDILLVEGRPYAIERIVADTVSPFIMGKVVGDRFTPVIFADTENRYSGMTLWTLSPDEEIAKTTLHSDQLDFGASDHGPAKIISSDKLNLALSIESARQFLSGTPVFDLSGQLVGFSVPTSDKAQAVLPSDILQSLMLNVLKDGKPRRPFLGLTYVFDFYLTEQNNQTGAIIYGEKPNNGIVPKSPAARAGLKLGDRLLSVNGTPISSSGSLFSLVQQYHPGDTIIFEYIRQSQKFEAAVIAEELPVKK